MSAPLTVIARVRAKPGLESRLREELQCLIAPTRAEAGCIDYILHESQTDPGLFVLYENWTGQAALDAHFQTTYMKAFFKLIPEISDGPSDITKWTKL